MSEPERYTVTFTAAARRRLGRLPLSAATALYEHLTGPVAANPHRLGKPLDAPFEEVLSTRRGEYRPLYTVDAVRAEYRRRDNHGPHRLRPPVGPTGCGPGCVVAAAVCRGPFLPLRDGTSGRSSYGGGRYALDTAKGADLGRRDENLVIDLNFLYHPSCRTATPGSAR